MYKYTSFILFFMVLTFANLHAYDSNFVAERGGHNFDQNRNDFNRSNFQHDDYHHEDFNQGNKESFNRGEAYGVNRGAEYGAAYGAAAAGNSGGVPADPNAVEQDLLYYSGVKSAEQGQ